MSEPDALDARARAGGVTAYIGFDCTAASLHIGSLLPIMMLYWLQQTGHKPIALMGGGTTKVGDPSGKDEARQLLDDGAIARNMASIKRAFSRFLRFGDGPADAVMVDNAEWLDRLEYGVFGLPRPDLTIYLRMPTELSVDLLKEKRAKDKKSSYLENGKQDTVELDISYLEHAQMSAQWLMRNQQGWLKIECAPEGLIRTRETIAEEVYRLVITP